MTWGTPTGLVCPASTPSSQLTENASLIQKLSDTSSGCPDTRPLIPCGSRYEQRDLWGSAPHMGSTSPMQIKMSASKKWVDAHVYSTGCKSRYWGSEAGLHKEMTKHKWVVGTACVMYIQARVRVSDQSTPSCAGQGRAGQGNLMLSQSTRGESDIPQFALKTSHQSRQQWLGRWHTELAMSKRPPGVIDKPLIWLEDMYSSSASDSRGSWSLSTTLSRCLPCDTFLRSAGTIYHWLVEVLL